jgi:gliding motility-associated lipoprotein GldD
MHYSLALCTIFSALCTMFSACEEEIPVPKPHAYPRVIYPTKSYVPFEKDYCSFGFEMPSYAKIDKDTSYFGEKPKNECWFNLSVPTLNAKIHCSYSSIKNKAEFSDLIQDAHVMAQKHNIKASYIEEIPIHRTKDKVHGILFNIEGPAASSYQFYLTDSTQNFFRGALYFNSQNRPDSIAPVLSYMKTDLNHIISTLKWNK